VGRAEAMRLINSEMKIERARGFTLVELLVGISVGLIVISGLTVAWGYFARQSDYIIKAAQFNQDTRSALQVVSQEIRRAVALENSTGLRVIDVRRVTCNGSGVCTDAADDVTANCILFDSNIVSRLALKETSSADVREVADDADGALLVDINSRTTPRPAGFRLANNRLQVWYGPGEDTGESRNQCSSSTNWVTLLQAGDSGVETLAFQIDTSPSTCVPTEILLDLSQEVSGTPIVPLTGRCPAVTNAPPDGGVWVESLSVSVTLSGTARIGSSSALPFRYEDSIKIRNLGLVDYDGSL
jgi:prepilin peptidase dependent protein B